MQFDLNSRIPLTAFLGNEKFFKFFSGRIFPQADCFGKRLSLAFMKYCSKSFFWNEEEQYIVNINCWFPEDQAHYNCYLLTCNRAHPSRVFCCLPLTRLLCSSTFQNWKQRELDLSPRPHISSHFFLSVCRATGV